MWALCVRLAAIYDSPLQGAGCRIFSLIWMYVGPILVRPLLRAALLCARKSGNVIAGPALRSDILVKLRSM